VLSTVHTNDALATVNRLSNMGVKPYLLGSSLALIVAQRLVRRICTHCQQPHHSPPEVLSRLGLEPGGAFYHGKGCRRCNRTGYYGRVALFEMLPIDKEFSRLISRGVSEVELRNAAQEREMVTLREAGIGKVEQGVTAVEEVVARTMQ
jgi:type IV pilus assembly protein PilB